MKRRLSIFLLSGSIGLVAIGFCWLYTQQQSSQDEEICVTPVTESMATSWQLYVSDTTVFPYSPDDPDWARRPLAVGTGTICGNFSLVPGHVLKLNGVFEADSNGTGADSWAWMADTTNVASVTIGGKDVTSKVVNTQWSAGSSSGADGHYRVPK